MSNFSNSYRSENITETDRADWEGHIRSVGKQSLNQTLKNKQDLYSRKEERGIASGGSVHEKAKRQEKSGSSEVTCLCKTEGG